MGSLEKHSMDWNASDLGKVSSGGLPLGPGLLTQKIFAVNAAIHEANKVAEVKIYSVDFPHDRYPLSPVNEIRVE